jgi:hypothetical protein
MISVIGVGFLFRLGVALAAFFCAWVALRLLDRATGFDFKRWISNEKNAHAVGVYLGLRVLAICSLFAIVLAFAV